VRAIGAREKLWMELGTYHKGMVNDLCYLHQAVVGRNARKTHTCCLKTLTIGVIKLKAMTMPFLYVILLVGSLRFRAWQQITRIKPQPHRSTHIGNVALVWH